MDLGTKNFIKASGRSWWRVQYWDGKVINEWETIETAIPKLLKNLPQMLFVPSAGKSSRWEIVEKKGLRGIQLLCPNGQGAGFETKEDYRIFQLKTGGARLGSGQYTRAHIIGVVDNFNGDCTCFAWETEQQKLVNFTDNVTAFKYDNIGALGLEVLGVKL